MITFTVTNPAAVTHVALPNGKTFKVRAGSFYDNNGIFQFDYPVINAPEGTYRRMRVRADYVACVTEDVGAAYRGF